MKDEKETLRKTADSIHVMESSIGHLADVTAPVVSLTMFPMHHTSGREERRDIWDRDMFGI